jgi:pimeloyl-ACP methyl ester carboxylesterase
MSDNLVTEFVASSDGTKIAYTKQGSGPAIVLVDGASCYRRAGITPLLLPVLSQHFTVYAYDRRGRDESGDTKPYAIQKEIDDLAAVMAVAGGSPYVCSFSSGAALALYAVASGLKPAGLALYEPPFVVVDDTDKPDNPDNVKIYEKLLSEGRRGDMVKHFLVKVVGLPAIFPFIMKTFMKKNWNNSVAVAHTFSYDQRIMDQSASRPPADVSATITVPTMVVYGTKTAPKLRKAAIALQKLIPGSRLKVLPRSSHFVKPAELVPLLRTEFK